MLRVVSDTLWSEIARFAKAARKKYAAVAYVTSDAHVQFGAGDVLVVDASDAAIQGGQTSVPVLRAALKRGAALYSLPGLHAKVFAFGRTVVIGSGNLSASSAESLIEAAIITDQPSAVAGVRTLIEQLTEQATPVDSTFIARAAKLEVARQTPSPTRRRPRIQLVEHRTWLVSIVPLELSRYVEEQELAEEGIAEAAAEVENPDSDVSWVRMTGNSRFRKEARPGDSVIQVWRKTWQLKRARVHPAAPILRRQEEPTCTRFYIESFADAESRALAWGAFEQRWRAATSMAAPGVRSVRLVPEDVAERLDALWSGE
ncbi:hypothetical protein [Polyangium aurulentum]|uniref:hypothetical protein n=1 Tax=Polyangium aurulentum TaxID=2567896 RepID=UPI0010AE4DF2|nr:hypothetical protein [Polyangium aurulentum]UQA61352.1 hypothetical protein E8A73_013100 [Polyangium aurulentum]